MKERYRIVKRGNKYFVEKLVLLGWTRVKFLTRQEGFIDQTSAEQYIESLRPIKEEEEEEVVVIKTYKW